MLGKEKSYKNANNNFITISSSLMIGVVKINNYLIEITNLWVKLFWKIVLFQNISKYKCKYK